MSHPTSKKIKQNFYVNEKFTFREVTLNEVERIIKNLPKKKAADGDITPKVLKKSKFSFEELRNCINYAFSQVKFPCSLKIVNVTLVRKKDYSTNKKNVRPVIVLPLLFKVFERLMYGQLKSVSYFPKKLFLFASMKAF